jgi:hypothetical protein
MTSLEEIQELVNQAQEGIKEHKLEKVRSVLWPSIKSAISQNSDLMRGDRQKLARLIYERLDNLGLREEETSANIDVAKMVMDIQAGGVPEPPKSHQVMWLPY